MITLQTVAKSLHDLKANFTTNEIRVAKFYECSSSTPKINRIHNISFYIKPYNKFRTHQFLDLVFIKLFKQSSTTLKYSS